MKIVNYASRVLGYVSFGVILALMLLTVSDVLLRYFFSSPITGTTEITEMMMVCLLLALAWCAVEGGHMRVDVVMKNFSPRVQAAVDSITLLISLGAFIILAWQGYVLSVFSRENYVQSSMLKISEAPIDLVLMVSFAMLCLATITLLIQKVVEIVRK